MFTSVSNKGSGGLLHAERVARSFLQMREAGFRRTHLGGCYWRIRRRGGHFQTEWDPEGRGQVHLGRRKRRPPAEMGSPGTPGEGPRTEDAAQLPLFFHQQNPDSSEALQNIPAQNDPFRKRIKTPKGTGSQWARIIHFSLFYELVYSS